MSAFAGAVGDLVLLGPRPLAPGAPPISETVTAVDGSAYSHATLLTALDGWKSTVLSANEETHGLRSGVNAIVLETVRDRPLAIVRLGVTDIDTAVKTALGYAEGASTPGAGPSEFAWEQLFLAGVAGVVRRMAPGVGRQFLWSTVHAVSAGLEDLPWSQRRWDCCEFVTRMFEEGPQRFFVAESDPVDADGRPCRDAGAVLGRLMTMWRAYLDAHLPGAHPTAVPSHDLGHVQPICDACTDRPNHELAPVVHDLLAALRHLARRALGVDALRELLVHAAPRAGERAWPPFVSPRMLLAAGRLVDTYRAAT